MQLDQPGPVHSFQCVQTIAVLSQLSPVIKAQHIFHLEILPLCPLDSLESNYHAKKLLVHMTGWAPSHATLYHSWVGSSPEHIFKL